MPIEDSSLSTHGYQLLPLATSYLVGNNRKLMYQAYFEVFFEVFIVCGRELITIEDPSLSDHNYQLLPLATSQ